MSFLKIFFKFLFLFLLLAGVGIFLTREVLLQLAVQQVGQQVQRITQLNRWQDSINQCADPEVSAEGPAFSSIQLRFIDQREYVVEVVCLNRTPVEVLRKTLPWGVEKTTGSAGMSFTFPQRELRGEFALSIAGRSRTLQGNTEDSTVERFEGETQFRSGIIVSACSAHGLTCCDAAEQVGTGEMWSEGVLDCPQNCASQCLQRPTLLSFQTDPVADHETRKVFLPGTSALVLFGYSFDDSESKLSEVTLDFGDGEIKTYAQAQQSQLTKEYACPSGSCTYTATVRAKDSRGIDSNLTRLSTIIFIFGEE